MLFIPKTSNFDFYDDCRYIQTQVFYNLPYISNHIINEFKNSITKHKLCFMPLPKKMCGEVLGVISTSNFYSISPIYLSYFNLDHTVYNNLIKKYCANLLSELSALLINNVNVVHFLYDSKVLNNTVFSLLNENLVKYVKDVITSVNILTYLVINTIVSLWFQIHEFMYNIYVSYCRCILYIMLNNSDGFVSPLLNSFDPN